MRNINILLTVAILLGLTTFGCGRSNRDPDKPPVFYFTIDNSNKTVTVTRVDSEHSIVYDTNRVITVKDDNTRIYLPKVAEPAPAVVSVPAEETPAEETPAEETPAEETPAEETPAEAAPADDATKPEQHYVLVGDVDDDNVIGDLRLYEVTLDQLTALETLLNTADAANEVENLDAAIGENNDPIALEAKPEEPAKEEAGGAEA